MFAFCKHSLTNKQKIVSLQNKYEKSRCLFQTRPNNKDWKLNPSQIIHYNSPFASPQNLPITSIYTGLGLSSWIDFDVKLSPIGSKQMIWILSFVPDVTCRIKIKPLDYMIIRLSTSKIIVINIPMAIWKSLRISIIKRWKKLFAFLSGFGRFPIYLQAMKKAHSYKYQLLSKYTIKFKCYSRYMCKKICWLSCPSLEKLQFTTIFCVKDLGYIYLFG